MTRGGNLLPSHDSIRFRFLRPRFDSKSIFDSKRFSIQNDSILSIMISNRVSDHDLLSSALLYRMTNGDIKVSFSHQNPVYSLYTMNRQDFDARCKIDAENWISQNSRTP